MKQTEMLLVSLRGVNFECLGVAGKIKIFQAVKVLDRVVHQEMEKTNLYF